MRQYNVGRSISLKFNFFILICIFVRPDWLFVRSKLASGLTNDLSMGRNYLQACSIKSGPLKVIGQFSYDGIGSNSCKGCQQLLVSSSQF